MADPWRLVVSSDRRGCLVDQHLVCPDCWPTHTEPVGRTRFGTTTVSTVRQTLHREEECWGCGRTPRLDELHAAQEMR